MYICVHPKKKARKIQHVLFLLCVPSVSSDLFLPHQIFSVKSDIWNREIHSTALHSALWKGQLSLKECVRPADAPRVPERRERGLFWTVGPAQRGWIYHRFLLCLDLVWIWDSSSTLCSALCCAELSCSLLLLNCSAGCCNLFSAWPDYCLLHIVWWRAAGWRDGRRRGEREGWRRLWFAAT